MEALPSQHLFSANEPAGGFFVPSLAVLPLAVDYPNYLVATHPTPRSLKFWTTMYFYQHASDVIRQEQIDLVEARKACESNADLPSRTLVLDAQLESAKKRLRQIELRHLKTRLTKVQLEAQLLTAELPLAHQRLRAAELEDDSEPSELEETCSSVSPAPSPTSPPFPTGSLPRASTASPSYPGATRKVQHNISGGLTKAAA